MEDVASSDRSSRSSAGPLGSETADGEPVGCARWSEVPAHRRRVPPQRVRRAAAGRRGPAAHHRCTRHRRAGGRRGAAPGRPRPPSRPSKRPGSPCRPLTAPRGPVTCPPATPGGAFVDTTADEQITNEQRIGDDEGSAASQRQLKYRAVGAQRGEEVQGLRAKAARWPRTGRAPGARGGRPLAGIALLGLPRP